MKKYKLFINYKGIAKKLTLIIFPFTNNKTRTNMPTKSAAVTKLMLRDHSTSPPPAKLMIFMEIKDEGWGAVMYFPIFCVF